MRRGLVIVEVALSLALLVGAGLLIQSLHRLASVRFGFRTDVSTVDLTLPRWIYSLSEERARFFRAALDRIAVDSRFGAIALASAIPPEGAGGDSVVADGKPESPAETAIGDVLQISVSPQYFKVMGVPLELGREYADTDNHKNTPVAIVNEAFARKYFSTENPIDRRVKMGRSGSDQPWLSIVGIVGNEKHQDFFHPMNWEETPIVFRPLHQEPPSRAFLVFRTSNESNAVAASLRKSIQAVDANVAIGRVQTMNERLSDKLSYPRFRATILSTFAALALSLAAIGLYAVLSQLIAQRTQEFGVRMALGAQKTDLLKLVLWEGVLLTLAGLAVGLMITLFLTELLRNLIYGLKTTDPWTLCLGSLLLVFVALLAMYVPAVRATSVDPTIAVRCE